jgi:glycosyltransferase involved in cell wall biosynthesis
MPKVSVLMSVFNKGLFLRDTMPSVLNQSFADFEFVIFNNKSTDDSAEIIREFSDNRIRFFENSRNIGPVASMNNCIEAASGDFLVFFHGDDLWSETFLETSIRFLDQNESINVCHSLVHSIDEHGRKYLSTAIKNVGGHEITPCSDVLKRLFKGCYVNTPTVVYRRKVMRYYDYRFTYVCDWDMYLQFAAAGNDFLFINAPLMYYRTSAGSETSIGVKGGELIIESYFVLRNFFTLHPEYSGFTRKTYKRLSDATLRRTRVTDSRERAFFLMRCAILCYPFQVMNPVFHIYLFIGLFFGPTGLRLLKSNRRKGKRIAEE